MPVEKNFHRRSIRLRGADYSEEGAYFLTICAAQRKCIFGGVENGLMELGPLGKIVRECWIKIPDHFPIVQLKEFVIMPNHLHGIVGLSVGARYIVPGFGKAYTPEAYQKPTKTSIPTIVRTFKAAVTRNATRTFGWKGEIWQRNYFERVLRDGKECADAGRYIVENPMKWEMDKENPRAEIKPSGS